MKSPLVRNVVTKEICVLVTCTRRRMRALVHRLSCSKRVTMKLSDIASLWHFSFRINGMMFDMLSAGPL